MEADWMANLPDELKSKQLIKLAIPGSHNSGAYNLTTELAPDAPEFIKKLRRAPGFASLLKNILQRLCNCQRLSIAEQLMSGIRYLDLRVSSSSNDPDLYLVHGLYGPKVIDVLGEIKEFLDNHPREIVILDFNHFYQMDQSHHTRLISQILSVFQSKLCERQELKNLTLKNMIDNQKQVIFIYHHRAVATVAEAWFTNSIDAPWPNTKCPSVCIRKLTQYMQEASDSPEIDHFFVCQGILTPNTWYTVSHLRKGSVQRLNHQLRPSFLSWLSQSPSKWKYQPNIVIHDFVDEDEYIQHVLNLNSHRITNRD